MHDNFNLTGSKRCPQDGSAHILKIVASFCTMEGNSGALSISIYFNG